MLITAIEDVGVDDPDLPSMKEPGRILFEIYHIYRTADAPSRYELEVFDHDGSTFWLQEGMGLDYFLQHDADIDLEMCGWYVMEGVTGTYHRGDGWTIDDDEDWEFERIRRADPAEIEGEALS